MSVTASEHVGSVPDEPVVLVEVDPAAGTVRLDGEPLDVPAGADPRLVGLHAAAWQVAHVLGRPVRTLVRTGDEQSWWVARPDGSADALRRPAPPVTSAAPAVPDAPADPAPPVAATERHRVVPAWLGWLVGTAASLTVVGTVITVLTLTGDVSPGDGEPGSTPTTEVRGVGTAPSAPPASAGATPSADPAPAPAPPTVTVRATGEVRLVRLVVTASERPVRAQVELTSVDDGRTRATVRRVRLTERRQAVVLGDLAAGRYRWRVSVPGAAPATGRVRVAAPPEVPSAAPTDEAPTQAPPQTAPQTPPQTPPKTPPKTPDNGGGGNGDGNGGGPDAPVGSSTQGPDPDQPVPND